MGGAKVKKILSKLSVFLCAFVLLFCFSGCTIIPGIDFGGGSGGGSSTGGGSGGGTSSGGIGSGDYTEEPIDDPEFEQDEDGNYTYYSDYIEQYYGVRVMSVPPEGQTTDNETTNTERRRFYIDAKAQFEVLSQYILYYLVGSFGSGIGQTTIAGYDSEFGSDYTITLPAMSPVVRDADAFDSDELLIERVITNYVYDGTTLSAEYDSSRRWSFNLEGSTSNYANNFVEKYASYVEIKLVEFVLNSTTGTNYNTTWAEASNIEQCQQKITEYIRTFTSLGLEMGEISQSGSLANYIYNFILNEIIGSTALNYNQTPHDIEEPTYTISNEDGTTEETYYDVNGNGVQDSVTITYTNYRTVAQNIVQNLIIIVSGEDFSDLNQNGQYDSGEPFTDTNGNNSYDEGFIKIDAMEVQDYTSAEFFRPGTQATEESPRKLDNMPYAEYKSVVFFPNEPDEDGNNGLFDTMTIYVDSETAFSMKLWLRVHIDDETEYTVPICILNLNPEEDCDWTNESDDEIDWGSGGMIDDLPDSWTDPEELFNDEERNSVWLIEMDQLLTEEQYALISSGDGTDAKTTFEYAERGHHTNSKDNTSLKDLYSKFEFGEEGQTSTETLAYADDSAYFEFIFEILDRQPDTEYNFKFLIMPSFWDIGNIEDDFTIEW